MASYPINPGNTSDEVIYMNNVLGLSKKLSNVDDAIFDKQKKFNMTDDSTYLELSFDDEKNFLILDDTTLQTTINEIDNSFDIVDLSFQIIDVSA